MGNKYCKKLHPVIAQAKGASNVWKKLVAVRNDLEHHIWCQLKGGTSSFWFDNWTKQGALYFVDNALAIHEEIEVKEFISDGEWNLQKLQEFLTEETVEYIQDTISPKLIEADNYKALWMGETNRKFTVKSAWEETRLKQDNLEAYRYIWLKGLPIKISLFLWRVWKRCIATDDNLKRMHINIVSRCCRSLFYGGKPMHLESYKGYFKPCRLSLCERSGKEETQSNMTKIHHIAEWYTRIPPDWHAVIDLLSNYKPKLHYCKVLWKMPQHGLKCNTDGAS
ncbi:uncharacterized protein LOC132628653 [Lycium barbarum]|uniref:uncharacterized protein LOC132628653 n=1 Tax=Lycium barbarum TaxID=112863 RepID=UPI00293E15DF|nr:uncharacterized protein LOC132628653 [Lycium barbarum]